MTDPLLEIGTREAFRVNVRELCALPPSARPQKKEGSEILFKYRRLSRNTFLEKKKHYSLFRGRSR